MPSNIPRRLGVLVYIRKASNLTIVPRYDLVNNPDIWIIKVIGIENFLMYNIYDKKEKKSIVKSYRTLVKATIYLTNYYFKKSLTNYLY